MYRSAMKLLQITLCLTVLVVETYSRISWTREILHRTKRQAECKPDEFKCTSGECIDIVSMCDGTKECADGSDEFETTWKQLNTTDSPSPPEGGCLLPQPPEFGAYTSPVCQFDKKATVCNSVPGTPVPRNWLLAFKCNERYYLKETQDANFNVFCVDGKWSSEIPVCRKMCPPLLSSSVDVRCFNEEGNIDCSKPMRPGTRAKGECKPSYTRIRPPLYTEIFCQDNGQWSYELFYCQPGCGKRNKQGMNNPLIVDGSASKYIELPWHVSLYHRNESNQWYLVCGGSLISPHIVLTAAHCVFSEQKEAKLPPEAIKVGLGKYYREWTHDELYAVKSNVRKILIPPRYYGQRTSYTRDIALLDLTESVQVHESIMPACVDWKRQFIITHGMLGKWAGWGRTENGTHGVVLLYADLPYIDYGHCLSEVPHIFQHYVTPDKFCANFSNGTNPTIGDSGGGLTFVQHDLYYVYGILSTKLKSSVNSPASFTDVSNLELLDWLYNAKHELDEEHPEKCPPTSFQCAYGICIDGNKRCNGQDDCADGSDEAALECSRTTQVTVSVPLKCKDTEFKCISGHQCIDTFFVCDGRVDCPDGSDETESQCSIVSPSSLPQRGGCLLPQPPKFGAYTGVICAFKKTAACRQTPGTHVSEDWGLSFKCNEGYYIKETPDENSNAYCISGEWSPKIPTCRKMCSPLVSLSVAVRCYNGEGDIDCRKPMRPGTRAKGECKPSYTQIQPPPYSEIYCRDNGQWSYELFYCQPVCGKRNKQGVNNPLIGYGSATKYGEFPWHVGLYMMNASNQWELACGGSLISPHIVLTAAHCVFSDQIKAKLPPEALKVGLGKYYREWTHDEPHATQANVREILIPPRYFGQATSYTQDIALLDLTHSVQIHASIMPVCIDWRREFILTPGMLGTLAGWGGTENGTSSDILLYADLPYIDYHHCINEVPQVFQHYVTADKFCGGFSNGTGAVKGDSGGGLTFVRDDLHYLYGIVSTKVRNANSFVTFTNISNVEIFIWLNSAKNIFDEAHLET